MSIVDAFSKLKSIREKYWCGTDEDKDNALTQLRSWWLEYTKVRQDIRTLDLPESLKVVLFRTRHFDAAVNALLQPSLELYLLQIRENLDQIASETEFNVNEDIRKELSLLSSALDATAERSSILKALSESTYALVSLISVRGKGGMRTLTSDIAFEMKEWEEEWEEDWEKQTFDFIQTAELITRSTDYPHIGQQVDEIWEALQKLSTSVEKSVEVQLQATNISPSLVPKPSEEIQSDVTSTANEMSKICIEAIQPLQNKLQDIKGLMDTFEFSSIHTTLLEQNQKLNELVQITKACKMAVSGIPSTLPQDKESEQEIKSDPTSTANEMSKIYIEAIQQLQQNLQEIKSLINTSEFPSIQATLLEQNQKLNELVQITKACKIAVSGIPSTLLPQDKESEQEIKSDPTSTANEMSKICLEAIQPLQQNLQQNLQEIKSLIDTYEFSSLKDITSNLQATLQQQNQTLTALAKHTTAAAFQGADSDTTELRKHFLDCSSKQTHDMNSALTILQNLTKDVDRLKTYSENAENNNTRLFQAFNDLQNQLHSIPQLLKSEIEQVRQHFNTLSEKTREIIAKLTDCQNERINYTKRINRLEREKEELRKEIDLLHVKNKTNAVGGTDCQKHILKETLRDNVEMVANYTKDAVGDTDYQKQTLQETEREKVEELASNKAEVSIEPKQLAVNVEKLKEEKISEMKAQAQLKKEKDELQIKIKELEFKYKYFTNHQQEVERKSREKERKSLKKFTNVRNLLEGELKQLKEELKQLKEELERLEQEKQSEIKAKIESEEEIRKLTTDLENSRAKEKTLLDKLEKCNNTCTPPNPPSREYEGKIRTLEHLVKEKTIALDQTQKEAQTMKQKLAESESERKKYTKLFLECMENLPVSKDIRLVQDGFKEFDVNEYIGHEESEEKSEEENDEKSLLPFETDLPDFDVDEF